MSNPADAVAGRPAVAAPGLAGLVESWRQIVFSGNLAPGRPIDAVSRWLLITRACVFPMTLTSGLISVFYVAPPLKLKHHGLGEPGVFLVWGPLMTGGTYFVTAGSIPGWVWLASLPYALSVTTVLIGKHIDKYEQDGARGIHTLPVL